jgi:Ku protein
MPWSSWKGVISFGLVSIPIRLYPAARPSRINLHQLHSVCKTRLRQPLYCPHCERIVDRKEVVKGYEEEDGTYVVVAPEEIKKIAPESSRVMDILSFAKQSEIDPLFFDSSYFVVAEEEGRKAYQLLLKTLEDTKRVGISKVTLHQREYTAFLRPYDHGLALHTMYFANEIREAPGYGKTDNIKLSPQEIKLAEQLVSTLSEGERGRGRTPTAPRPGDRHDGGVEKEFGNHGYTPEEASSRGVGASPPVRPSGRELKFYVLLTRSRFAVRPMACGEDLKRKFRRKKRFQQWPATRRNPATANTMPWKKL